jgi:hypothetical protein
MTDRPPGIRGGKPPAHLCLQHWCRQYMKALAGWRWRTESISMDFQELRQGLCEAPCKGSPTALDWKLACG